MPSLRRHMPSKRIEHSETAFSCLYKTAENRRESMRSKVPLTPGLRSSTA